jgi:hypothetical protein
MHYSCFHLFGDVHIGVFGHISWGFCWHLLRFFATSVEDFGDISSDFWPHQSRILVTSPQIFGHIFGSCLGPLELVFGGCPVWPFAGWHFAWWELQWKRTILTQIFNKLNLYNLNFYLITRKFTMSMWGEFGVWETKIT